MADFYGKWVCEGCLAELEELVQWLKIHAGTLATPSIKRAIAILTEWNSVQTARNHVTADAATEKEEVKQEYISR